ncbi:NTP transferase domain-containing protein [Litorivivens sp.]|uniref:nucleotidyltransferase family protein n=1 Tax=Litorivivens sp. TaxID=2020868 RepID=UPI00356AD2E1
MSRPVGVLLLASGASRRFGSDKRLAQLPSGLTLLEHMLAIIDSAGLPCRVTVRHGDSLGIPHKLELMRANEGMGSSIAGAVALLSDDFDALMILPVDLPALRSDTLTRLARGVGKDTLRRPVFDGNPGHPVVFGKAYYGDLGALAGEGGAQSVLDTHLQSLEQIVVDDCGVCCDIDTPDALRELIAQGVL